MSVSTECRLTVLSSTLVYASKRGNVLAAPIKGENFLEQLSDYNLLKKDSVAYGQIMSAVHNDKYVRCTNTMWLFKLAAEVY